ncbi:MAG: nicotinate phosphoribosyltransferase [Gammaproteobacteria bacterium]|nr:nicotinate phosphoribosyltransferase [Gammaproteobacteria bacterium]
MNSITRLYRHSLSLLTDLYQLTMAYGYWKSGTGEQEAVFNLFFRKQPFKGGFSLAAGLAGVIDYLNDFHFSKEDVDYLASLSGNDGKPLFENGFLDYLTGLRLRCDVDAIPEGTAVFPHEPLIRVRGPLLQCQLLETPLLNLVNFQTLIATKAARVCMATQGEPVLEFGLRRAQGIDGGLSASRAAYIGGCAATSNVLAGKLYGIPVKGTHAHSWVMCFDSEAEAFETYAKAMPNNCVFLVDTYDTVEGVRLAIEAGRKLREQGHEMVGIRLDSGDLAQLSITARKMLDQAGFPQAGIVASNDLNEYSIQELKQRGAAITVWGVGTKLATAYEQAALGGVYKLTAIRAPDGKWLPRLKLSEEPLKISNPGILQVRRFRNAQGLFIGDILFNILAPPADGFFIPPLANSADAVYEDLLVPVFDKGKQVYTSPELADIQKHARDQQACLHEGVKRFTAADEYPLTLEAGLRELKQRLIEQAQVKKK